MSATSRDTQMTEARPHMAPEFEPGLVSVIIPTFNRRGLLAETLQSVRAQTYRPIEVLIVDDGSNDGTSEAVSQWATQLSEPGKFSIQYFLQNHRGATAARNRGLAESKGEFIQFLDSDDLLHNRKFEFQAGLLAGTPQADYVFSDMAHFVTQPQWDPVPSGPQAEVPPEALFLSYRLLTMVGMMRRRLCVTMGGWDETLTLGDDLDYFLRMIISRPHVTYIPGHLCSCREHQQSRLTDGLQIATRDQIKLDLYRHLLNVAIQRGVGRDPSFGQGLARLLVENAVGALKTGRTHIARESLRETHRLTLSAARRVRINALWVVSFLPKMTLRALVWLQRARQ